MSYLERYNLIKRAVGRQPDPQPFFRRSRFERDFAALTAIAPPLALPPAREAAPITAPPWAIVIACESERGHVWYRIDGEVWRGEHPGPEQYANGWLMEGAHDLRDGLWSGIGYLEDLRGGRDLETEQLLRADWLERIHRSEGRF